MGDTLLELDYKPHLPSKLDYGIAIVGCGNIVRAASLPCYRKFNLNVIGCYDVNRESAEQAAQHFSIPRVYDSLHDLIADPAVAIVEIAVTPWAQFEIARQVMAAGKHLLCQKPLSNNLAQAVELVRLAREAKIKLAVNQQMRWDPATRAAHTLINRGWIGQPTDVVIQASLRAVINPPESWTSPLERFELYFHSIHYLDSVRFLFGDPEWVTGRHTRSPLQGSFRGETKTITVLDYASGLQALVVTNLSNPGIDEFVSFRFIGTEGVISGTWGLLNYPDGQPDTLTWQSQRHYPDKRFEAQLEGTWFPDAFIGPIASLMQAIQDDSTPETNGTDHLNTLRLIEAAYCSAADNRSVKLSEIA